MARALFLLVIFLSAAQIHSFGKEDWDAGWDIPYMYDLIELEENWDNVPCEINEALVFNPKCSYRGDVYPEVIYQWYANTGCFGYLQPNLMNTSFPRPNITTCIYDNRGTVPCFLITSANRSSCHQLDVRNKEAMEVIRRAVFSDAVFNRWIRCTEAAKSCCTDVLANSTSENGTCPAVWDAWSCFDPEQAGEVSLKVCPEFAYSNSGPACYHYAEKTCFQNATWNQTTNYATCSIIDRLVTRAKVHVACLATAIGLGLPAVIVLLSYKRLRARRLALHRNLLMAILLRNMLVIITKVAIVLDELTAKDNRPTAMSQNEFPCKLLASLEKLASSAAFTCMLVDGIFLHRSIVAVFKRELNHKIVYSVAIAMTIIPVVIWICLMVTMNDEHCWIVYSTPGIQWVLDGPRIAMLVINTILLIDIMRILLTKLRRKESSNQLSTTKATLFLMPLFGVQFLLTAWRPNTTSCDWEQGYYFFTYIMDGLQGVMVAFLYCYLNKEVHMLIRATYKKTETVVSTRFRSEAWPRRGTAPTNGKRETFSTIVDNKPDEEQEENGNSQSDLRYSESIIDRPISDSEFPRRKTARPSFLPIEEIDAANSLTILNNSYSPSDDGFVSLDFEYDEAPPQDSSYHSGNLNLAIPPFCPSKRLSKENSLDATRFEARKPGEYDVWSINPAYEEDVPEISVTDFDSVQTTTKPDIHQENGYSTAFGQQNDSAAPQKQLAENDFNNNDNSDNEVQKSKHLRTVHPFVGLVPEDFNESNNREKVDMDSSIISNFDLPNGIVENLDALGIYKESFQNNSISDGDELDGWKDVYIDPKKFCPNRPSSEKTIFLD